MWAGRTFDDANLAKTVRYSTVSGCVASTVFERFRHLAEALEGPSIGHFSKDIKHSVCSIYPRCNTSLSDVRRPDPKRIVPDPWNFSSGAK
jgi:hypothetical protein